ncbi:Protein of unknown function [Gryllus bimaculatus]|nr:Protein of unknown function [Gryllus bimaculatus]
MDRWADGQARQVGRRTARAGGLTGQMDRWAHGQAAGGEWVGEQEGRRLTGRWTDRQMDRWTDGQRQPPSTRAAGSGGAVEGRAPAAVMSGERESERLAGAGRPWLARAHPQSQPLASRLPAQQRSVSLPARHQIASRPLQWPQQRRSRPPSPRTPSALVAVTSGCITVFYHSHLFLIRHHHPVTTATASSSSVSTSITTPLVFSRTALHTAFPGTYRHRCQLHLVRRCRPLHASAPPVARPRGGCAAAPRHATPRHATPHHATPHHATRPQCAPAAPPERSSTLRGPLPPRRHGPQTSQVPHPVRQHEPAVLPRAIPQRTRARRTGRRHIGVGTPVDKESLGTTQKEHDNPETRTSGPHLACKLRQVQQGGLWAL